MHHAYLVSHPGEFYTVFWTDHLIPPIFWRMAEVNVPSGGTNTSWSEGNCAEMMMRLASSPPATATKVLSQEEAEQWLEARRAQSEASRKFLMDKLQEANLPKEKSATTTTLEAEAPAEEEPPSGPPTCCRRRWTNGYRRITWPVLSLR